MKLCKICNTEKQESEFYPNRRICKSCYVISTSDYQLKHPEQNRKYSSKWRSENIEQVRENNRNAKAQEYQENKTKILDRIRNYYHKNSNRLREYSKEWKINHAEDIRVYEHNRRAKKNGNGGYYTTQEWLELCEKYGNKCLRCGKTKKLSPDHIVPISKGGTSYIENIQPLCNECNSWKRTKTIDYRSQTNPN